MNSLQKNNQYAVCTGILAAVSLLFIIIGLANFVEIKYQRENNISLVAEISEIKEFVQNNSTKRVYHRAVVKYLIENKEYFSMLDYYSTDMKVGDKLAVICDKSNPSHAVAEYEYIMTAVSFCSLGVLVALGVILLIFQMKHH